MRDLFDYKYNLVNVIKHDVIKHKKSEQFNDKMLQLKQMKQVRWLIILIRLAQVVKVLTIRWQQKR